ncbi:hypothetical protein [Paucilactobacillus nenjiangensis]|jgi:hypothetical protein|uniref:hypothetical protein n=1 Tax=Paucilactobacillus nenjiangensis TaxID=1296540 RepID=UPI003BB65D4E
METWVISLISIIATLVSTIVASIVAFFMAIWRSKQEIKQVTEQIKLTNQTETNTEMRKEKLKKAASLYGEIDNYIVNDFKYQFNPYLALINKDVEEDELKDLRDRVISIGDETKSWSELEILLAYFPDIQAQFHTVEKEATQFIVVDTWKTIYESKSLRKKQIKDLTDKYIEIANEFISVKDKVLMKITELQADLENKDEAID